MNRTLPLMSLILLPSVVLAGGLNIVQPAPAGSSIPQRAPVVRVLPSGPATAGGSGRMLPSGPQQAPGPASGLGGNSHGLRTPAFTAPQVHTEFGDAASREDDAPATLASDPSASLSENQPPAAHLPENIQGPFISQIAAAVNSHAADPAQIGAELFDGVAKRPSHAPPGLPRKGGKVLPNAAFKRDDRHGRHETEAPKTQAAVALARSNPKAGAQIQGSLLIDGVPGGSMSPGRPAQWTFGFLDPKTGRPIRQYDIDHEKPMHLIVVSRDLDRFAHVHPQLDTGSGQFKMRVNELNADPDNQDAGRAVPKPGTYLLFGEVKPRGMGVQRLGFTAKTTGGEDAIPLRRDAMVQPGVIRKFFKDFGEPGNDGDKYQITLTIEAMPGMTHLTLNIQEMVDHGGHRMYMPVQDIQNWLGMPGHAVLISQAGDTAETKVFRHLHAGSHHGGSHGDEHGDGHNGHGGSGPVGSHGGGHQAHAISTQTGPDLLFMISGQDVVPAGTYKMWGQFKRRGQILTVPFVFPL